MKQVLRENAMPINAPATNSTSSLTEANPQILTQDFLPLIAQKSSTSLSIPSQSISLKKSFKRLVAIRNYHAALRVALELYSLDPKNVSNAYDLITCSCMAGEVELAHQIRVRMRKLKTNDIFLNFIRAEAKCLGLMGQHQESINKYFEAIYLFKKRCHSLSLFQRKEFACLICRALSEAYASIGKYSKSNFYLRKELHLTHPTITHSYNALALQHKQLLVLSGKGLGDAIQNYRFVRFLESLGMQVFWQVSNKLHTLFRESSMTSCLVENISILDAKTIPSCHIRYLRAIMDFHPDNPIGRRPYLSSSQHRKQLWKQRLKADGHLLIGINWAGDPESINDKWNLFGRSLRLDSFYPISLFPGVKLISLQKGEAANQLSSCTFMDKFVDCQDLITSNWDFCENAAIISCCDLVITNDTVVAHLSAALGKPTWTLLKKVPSWRWEVTGKTTFMYSTMRLFRQQFDGDWAGVMREVSMELASILYTREVESLKKALEIPGRVRENGAVITGQGWVDG